MRGSELWVRKPQDNGTSCLDSFFMPQNSPALDSYLEPKARGEKPEGLAPQGLLLSWEAFGPVNSSGSFLVKLLLLCSYTSCTGWERQCGSPQRLR